jgi:Cu/Ag efflux protein CusF
MLRSTLCLCTLAGCLSFAALPAAAQEVVHALTGTVSSIDAAGKTITLFQDTGSQGTFNEMTNHKTAITIDKKLLAEATPADDFSKKGAYVIVFYFGGESRTAVALRPLGTGPFTSAVGTVTKYEGHSHIITIKDDSGKEYTFKLSEDTVAEGGFGAVNGYKFQVEKGDHVRVVGTSSGNDAMALFVRQM